MTTRVYLSEIIGDGLSFATAFRPAIYDLLPAPKPQTNMDGRRDRTVAGGWAWCVADVSDVTHAAVSADARVVVLPFENAGGAMLDLSTATVGDVPSAKRTLLTTRLEAIGVPLQGLTLGTPLLQVVRRIKRTLQIRSWLGLDDYTEGMDTLVSAMNSAKKARANTILQAKGFDTSGLNALTIREAQKTLTEQEINAFRGT